MLLYFAIIAWLGAELFFPVVAQITFSTLAPQTHMAGVIVGGCLAILHHEAIVCAALLALGLIGAGRAGIYKPGSIRTLLAVVMGMAAITLVSQLTIIPSMDAYRAQAGGAIDAVPVNDPNRIAFDHLHKISVYAEEGVVLLGLAFVVLLARAEGLSRMSLQVTNPIAIRPSNSV